MSTVVFDPVGFLTRYPEFTSVSGQLQYFFNEACLYCKNDDTALIDDPPRTLLLWMLTAHVAKLDANDAVGRVSQAKEGSVSANLDMGPVPGSGAWFMQTKYGAAFWQASRQFRSGPYLVLCETPNFTPGGWQ